MAKRIYLAGAIGCYKDEPESALKWRLDAGVCVRRLNKIYGSNFKTFNPAINYNYWKPSHKTEKEIMRFDFNRIKQCDVVLVNLKDIDKSIGTTDEILFSYLHGVPVIGFYEDSDDISFVHPWKIEQIDRIEIGEDALQSAVEYIVDYYS